MEVGCSAEGARALMAAMENPGFSKNITPAEATRAGSNNSLGGEIGKGDEKPKRPKAKGKAKAKSNTSSGVMMELPEKQDLVSFKDDWVDSVSTAQGICAKLASELLGSCIT